MYIYVCIYVSDQPETLNPTSTRVNPSFPLRGLQPGTIGEKYDYITIK